MDPAALILVALFFFAIMGLVIGLWVLINPSRSARDRLSELSNTRSDVNTPMLVHTTEVSRFATLVGRLAEPSNAEEIDKARKRLIQAGFRNPAAYPIMNAVRVGLFLLLPAIVMLLIPDDTRLYFKVAGAVFMASLGYFSVGIYLDRRVETRRKALMRPFPDALDLLVSSAEAGLALDASIRRVATEMEAAAPELAFELGMVTAEMAAGVSRTDALRHLDSRTGLQEVNSLVNVLVQADRYGTSVAAALRAHAHLVRTKRMQAAEERAAKVSPKMTVAMILFLFPSLFMVLLGPAVVNIIKLLMPTLEKGR